MTYRTHRFTALHFSVTLLAVSFGSIGCYSPTGPTPERPGSAVTRDWPTSSVEQLVQVTYETIHRPITTRLGTVPAACQDLHFIRIKLRAASDDASKADAAMLMVPGILAGANSFHAIGQQLVYTAKTEFGRTLEVWGMDRRGNCMEDLTGLNAAEQAPTAAAAENTLLDYYYFDKPLNGKRFAGFDSGLLDKNAFLSDFGMKLTIEDMYAIMNRMIPDQSTRRKKLFVGGHSLGCPTTSAFLAWDFDGNPNTLTDAGYNNAAGAFAFDSYITSLDRVPLAMFQGFSTSLAEFGFNTISDVTEALFDDAIQLLDDGFFRTFEINGVFTPEVIMLTEALGMLAHKAPNAPHTAIRRLPQSEAVRTMLGIFHSRTGVDFFSPPNLADYNYTNEAMLGVFFDDDFSPLNIIRVSTGFLAGGPVAIKNSPTRFLDYIPGGRLLFPSLLGAPLFIAADAGPDLEHLGTGPLYHWVNFDRIGQTFSDTFTDTTGVQTYTTKGEEMSDMQTFAKALYQGETNLTQAFFPNRIVIDGVGMAFPWAGKFDLRTLHQKAQNNVPVIEFLAENGPWIQAEAIFPRGDAAQRVVLKGFDHLDPMFATPNASRYQDDQVVRPLIRFMVGLTREVQ